MCKCRERHTPVYIHIQIYSQASAVITVLIPTRTYTPARAKYTRAKANSYPPVCVYTHSRVSQALGKAAGCLLRRWEEQESKRVARCVVYICLCM